MLNLDELKSEFIKISREAYTRGLISGAGGNLSVRIPGTEQILIKPSGATFREPRLLLIDFKGNIIEGTGKPSIEQKLHIGIYTVRADVGAVIHTHSPAATAFAVVGKEVPMVTAPALIILKKCPLIGYAPPGSKKLAEYVVSTFKDTSVKTALLQNHGVIAVGKNLTDALNNADLLEDTAKIAILASQLGKPKKIPKTSQNMD
jgi:L-ribulose-5-phosphate 4-epimerase